MSTKKQSAQNDKLDIPIPLMHHAYVVYEDIPSGLRRAKLFLEDALKVSLVGNPDVHIFEGDEFTIDDARQIRLRQLRKPLGEYQYVIIAAERYLRDAQNAFLKTLEEPSARTVLFLIVRAPAELLPTVRSRVFEVYATSPRETDAAAVFVQASFKDRLAMVAALLEKSRGEIALWCDMLASFLSTDPTYRIEVSAREAVELCRKHIHDRGASPKLLLEYIALSLP